MVGWHFVQIKLIGLKIAENILEGYSNKLSRESLHIPVVTPYLSTSVLVP